MVAENIAGATWPHSGGLNKAVVEPSRWTTKSIAFVNNGIDANNSHNYTKEKI